MATAIASPHPGAIHSLQRPTATRLRSALIIPNLAHVLNELAQNSLDAGARRIDAWVSLARGAEGVRVEDDGSGVAPEDVPGLAEPHSKCQRKEGADAK
jgi:DNA mismatch repair ATPase MutL